MSWPSPSQLVERSFGRYWPALDLSDDEARILELRQQLGTRQWARSAIVPWGKAFEVYEKNRRAAEGGAALLRHSCSSRPRRPLATNSLWPCSRQRGTLVSLRHPPAQGRCHRRRLIV